MLNVAIAFVHEIAGKGNDVRPLGQGQVDHVIEVIGAKVPTAVEIR